MKRLLFQNKTLMIAFVLLAGAFASVFFVFSITLSKTTFASGATLFAFILFLASYQIRKKLFFLSLGNTSLWLQIHIFIGLMSCLLFVLHISFRLPNGWLEGILFCCYTIVFLSGVLGWFLSRTVPSRLLSCGEEVLFERIPIHRKQLLDHVETLVFESSSLTEGSAIPEFYLRYLRHFFESHRNLFRHLFHFTRHRHKLLQKTSNINSLLNEEEKIIMQKITNLIKKKDDLDRQHALQLSLKAWLFVHVPLTYSLIIFALFHIVAVFAFASTSG